MAKGASAEWARLIAKLEFAAEQFECFEAAPEVWRVGGLKEARENAMRISDIWYQLIGARETNCPNEASILAYSENRLSRGSYVRFERHFAVCEDCREVLAFLGREPELGADRPSDETVSAQTERVLAYIQNDERAHQRRTQPKHAPATNGRFSPYPRLAAVGVVFLAIVIAGVFVFNSGSTPSDSAMEAYRAAVRDRRYTEARVSGETAYSPYSTTRGGNRANDHVDSSDLHFSRALGKVRSAEQEGAPTDERLVLARIYLGRAKREDSRRALEILNQLAARGVETPQLLNDIGVAHLQLEHYQEAIDYFIEALAKSPSYDPALFNLALAEERADRTDEARRDWLRFLEESEDENWKSEARTHLNNLPSTRAQ